MGGSTLGPAITTATAPTRSSSRGLVLPEREVHVWPIDLDHFSAGELYRQTLLSPDERERAARFHFDRDRKRFVAARQTLRMLAGAYLHLEPRRVSFRYSPHGKPELATVRRGRELSFNISHSGPMGLFVFVWERKVGVDVEQLRADIQVMELADRFFSPCERASLRGLSAQAQGTAFFACWTRKEAFVKAKGEGLSLPLDQFDVSLAADRPAEILATRPDGDERGRWSMWSLDVGKLYQAALVVEGTAIEPVVYSCSSAELVRQFS